MFLNLIKKVIKNWQKKVKFLAKTKKSKCYYAAGWYSIKQNTEYATIFCPKYIFIQRYPYYGPFMNADDVKIDKLMNSLLGSQRQDLPIQ